MWRARSRPCPSPCDSAWWPSPWRANCTRCFKNLDEVPAPGQTRAPGAASPEAFHYDAWADGRLLVAGWLWDPQQRVQSLDLFVDGRLVGPLERGLNRVDVYRAVQAVVDPNVGY